VLAALLSLTILIQVASCHREPTSSPAQSVLAASPSPVLDAAGLTGARAAALAPTLGQKGSTAPSADTRGVARPASSLESGSQGPHEQCQTLLRTEFRAAAGLLAQVRSMSLEWPRCIPFGGSFFALVPEELSARKCAQSGSECEQIAVEFALVRIELPRAKAAGPKIEVVYAVHHENGEESRTDDDHDKSFHYEHNRQSVSWPRIEAAYDYNGDGTPELVVGKYYAPPEATDVHVTLSVWSLSDNSLRPYDAAPTVEVVLPSNIPNEQRPPGAAAGDLVVDADGDGRPDLTWHGPYETTEVHDSGDEVCGAAPISDRAFIYHATVNGEFRANDVVAANHLRKWCPHKPKLSRLSEEIGALGKQRVVACARAWGATPAELSGAFERHCAQERKRLGARAKDTCFECFVPTLLIKQEPPIVLQ